MTETTLQPVAKCEKCGRKFLTMPTGDADRYAPAGIYMREYKDAGTAPTCGGTIVGI
jgi:hypothetical protein